MILDTIDRLGMYDFPEKQAVLRFLRETDLDTLADGRHDVNDRVYVNSGTFAVRDNRRLEGHKKYIDIQVVLGGAECMYWAPAATGPEETPYNPEKDVYFNDPQNTPLSALFVNSGMFALFFTDELHAPLNPAGCENSRKLIFKIPACD